MRPKDTNKKQTKQQEASPLVGGGDVDEFREEIIETLRRWGISNPAYLLEPGNGAGIPELIERSQDAVSLIDRTMKLREWTRSCGAGLRVQHLRDHIHEGWMLLERDSQLRQEHHKRLVAQAAAVVSNLPPCDESEVDELLPDRHQELLKRGLDAIGEPDSVKALVAQDPTGCRRIVAHELKKEYLGHHLDVMGDDDLHLLKRELFERMPSLGMFFKDTTPRSVAMRGLLVEQLRMKRMDMA